jgi:ethanolamine permease
MISVLQLRKTEPQLERPFKVPLYPLLPIIALTIAGISLVSMIYYNHLLGGIYILIIILSLGVFSLRDKQKITSK